MGKMLNYLIAIPLCCPLIPLLFAMKTRWSDDVSPGNSHTDYPRPQLTRNDWLNLNGLWNYTILPLNSKPPTNYSGEILVPFPIESQLSGVTREVGPANVIWYNRQMKVPTHWKLKRIILHFGAVDWKTRVWVDEKYVGVHRGGFDEFSFDITDYLAEDRSSHELLVEVYDPTDASTQPRGKQVTKPQRIWYTSVTGIWQTVWLEPVGRISIDKVKIVPKLEENAVTVDIFATGGERPPQVQVNILDNGSRIKSQTIADEAVGSRGPVFIFCSTLILPIVKLWSPQDPFLYDIQIVLLIDGIAVDNVKSYFGMRSVRLGTDSKGFTRILLNNDPVFQYGLLDQGFWPDGLYTAPSDEALKYDLLQTKKLGFNMVRKHVKVEPSRWYYWADKIGLLVWQDMPSGDNYTERYDLHKTGGEGEIRRTVESAKQFEMEWAVIMRQLFNHPSIVVWVPFNEGWGQYDTARIAAVTKKQDPSRLVNSVSGWYDKAVGDMRDVHNYPAPMAPDPEKARASVLGEFGGLGLGVEGHIWRKSKSEEHTQKESSWSYHSSHNYQQLTKSYLKLLKQLHPLIATRGLSAAIYTQTSDVEIEINGFMTYDRDIVKFNTSLVAAAHKELYALSPGVG